MNNLVKFYSGYDESGRLSRSRSRELEFIVSIHVIKQYANEGMEVIDLGSGPGAYTLALAPKMGNVLAVDMAKNHTDELAAKAKAKGLGNISIQCKSALEIESNEVGKFDIVLCFGPYYHLRNEADRISCLRKCGELAKEEGIIFVSYISRAAAVAIHIKNGIFFTNEQYDQVDLKNYEAELGIDRFLDISFYSDPDLVVKEAERAGLEIIDHVGIDGPWNILADKIENMNEQQWTAFRDYHLMHCRDKNTLGISNHGLVVCRVKK